MNTSLIRAFTCLTFSLVVATGPSAQAGERYVDYDRMVNGYTAAYGISWFWGALGHARNLTGSSSWIGCKSVAFYDGSLVGDGVVLFPSRLDLGYTGGATGATNATVNFLGNVKSNAGTNVFLTGSNVSATVVNSSGGPNSLSVPAMVGVLVTPNTSRAITINASADLTMALSSTQDKTLTVTGSAVVDLRGVNYGFAINSAIVNVDASAMTAGGLRFQTSNSPQLAFVGGAGDDIVGLGTVITGPTGSLDAGAGRDTLRTNNATFISALSGTRFSNFEIIDVAANILVNLAHLSATNTLNGLRLGGASNVIQNVGAAVAENVTIYASGSPNLYLIGATGNLNDTIRIDTNDGLPAVNTINMGAPGFPNVEHVFLAATDNLIISGLNNALALTSVTLSGAGSASLTTGAIAVNAGTTIDASALAGNFAFNATGSNSNGYDVKGSAGSNIITAGSAPLSADLTQSLTRADRVVLTSAQGSSRVAFQQINGFTNALMTGDKLDLIASVTLASDVVDAATGVSNLTGTIFSGFISFGGSAAATASLDDKIDAAASLAGISQYNVIAFEHAGNTYVYEQGDTTATYAAGVDFIIELTGVVGVTALSFASAPNTIFVQ